MHESFKDYVTVEPLEGENKYDAGEYGLQVRSVCCFLSMVGSLVEGNFFLNSITSSGIFEQLHGILHLYVINEATK